MAGQQGSARVKLKEIDLSKVSEVSVLPSGVPAAVVGPSKKGPAFVPKTFANIQQFNQIFGSMEDRSKGSNSNLYAPLALNEWFKNSNAGTFIRTLGVGDGSDAAVDAGFVAGALQVQSSNNKVGHTTNTTSSTHLGRTHMLGCFMRDVRNSNYLLDSGVQSVTNTGSTLADTFEIAANPAVGDKVEIFIPKELSSDLSSDVTITIELTANLTATPAKNTIHVEHGNQNQVSGRLEDVFNLTTAKNTASTNGVVKIEDLPFVMNDVFNVVRDASSNPHTVTITMVSTAKEGDFVTLNQTSGGTTLLGATSKTLQGANPASLVIRGVLMSSQGVIPSLDIQNSGDTNYAEYKSTSTLALDVAGKTFGTTDDGTNLVGYNLGNVDAANDSFKVILNGFDNSNEPAVISCSFDPDSVNYFAKVLNTDPTKIEERGHYLYAHWDIKKTVAEISNSGILQADGTTLLSNSTTDDRMLGFLLRTSTAGHNDLTGNSNANPNFEGFNNRFTTASTPWITSQYFNKLNNSSRLDGSSNPYTLETGGSKKLFRLHALDDGEIGNTQFRVVVSNLRNGDAGSYGSFDLALEKFDGDPVDGDIIVKWKKLSLDPTNKNYIARVIGNEYTYFDFEGQENRQRLVTSGDYPLRNNYVRVEVDSSVENQIVPSECLPCGFMNHSYLNTKITNAFKELGTDNSGANKLLQQTTTFDNIQPLPLPIVKSTSRKIQGTSTLEVDSSLAWGVKFALRKSPSSVDSDPKENSDLDFNTSLKSWTKFFSATTKALGTTDGFQNGSFSLEKVVVQKDSDDAISSWDGSYYSQLGTSISSVTINGSSARYVNLKTDANGKNARYLKFRCLFQGGFDGLNIFDKEKYNQTSTAAYREAQSEKADGAVLGATIMGYRKAIDVLSDKSAAEFQLLAIPGIREPQVTNYAVSSCEDRFDAMLIMDVEEMDSENAVIVNSTSNPNVTKTINQFSNRVLDTSFAAAYFPNVLITKPSTGGPIEVPPTVPMLGVMSQNDRLADPWFAPAGLSRGRLAASNVSIQMNVDLLDDLYDADINPIYEPAGRRGEVYAFGQKTLLQSQSALDRINVRRLLINLRRQVKSIANTLLFEPNRVSTLNKFNSLVEPILKDVKKKQGIERYKIQIDSSTTTQNDIENNTIRGKIYLQPTKSVEFISLDFVVTNSIN